MKKISFSTIFGFVLGIGFIFAALMESHRPELFWNLPSLYMIVGGTFATLITVFSPAKLKLFFPTMKRAFVRTKTDLRQDIETIVELSKEVRTKGLMSLENLAQNHVKDKFLYEGLILMADGVSSEDLKEHMEGVIYFTKKRHSKDAAMVELVANIAPSLGLVGTYVGLIPMLTNLDDPTSLGPMMAIELVSSFYGGVLANILFGPIARRLKMIASEEADRNEFILVGLLSIHEGKNPKVIEANMMAYANLTSKKKGDVMDIGGKKAKKKSSAA